MDRFKSKLYDKYNNLKRKLDDEEERIHRTEATIKAYQHDVEDLVEDLKRENDRLRSEIAALLELKDENDRLRSEIVALREKHEESQKQMLEESLKTKELSEEVGRLQNLLLQKNDNVHSVSPRSPCTSPRVRSRTTYKGSSKKKTPNSCARQGAEQDEETALVPCESHQPEQHVPDCCRNNITSSGNAMGKHEITCVFQTLMEFLVSMKISLEVQAEGPCLLAIHQRSGYTFTLTWIRRGDGGDGELMYRVPTLGTLERIALDWMKDDMIFSPAMFPVFFERIKRVLGRS